jgi:hypothetical protein
MEPAQPAIRQPVVSLGISNVATAAAGPLGLLVGGVALTGFSLAGLIAEGPRAAMALTLIFLVGAALTLRNVEEHRRED